MSLRGVLLDLISHTYTHSITFSKRSAYKHQNRDFNQTIAILILGKLGVITTVNGAIICHLYGVFVILIWGGAKVLAARRTLGFGKEPILCTRVRKDPFLHAG